MKPSDLYLTPPEILDGVRRVFGRDIDFDPFGHPNAKVSQEFYSLETGHDAYVLPWAPRVTVFMNPPFSEGKRALARFVDQFRTQGYRSGAVLCLTAPGSAYWRDCVWGWADYVTFLAKRVRFLNPDGTPMPNSFDRECAIVWYQNRAEQLQQLYMSCLGITVSANI